MFIQIIQGRCHDTDRMHQLSDEWRDELGPGAEGWLGGTYGVTDDGEFVAVVRFESREAATRNSTRPATAGSPRQRFGTVVRKSSG